MLGPWGKSLCQLFSEINLNPCMIEVLFFASNTGSVIFLTQLLLWTLAAVYCCLLFHQRQPGAGSVLVLEPLFYWFRPGASKEPARFSINFCGGKRPMSS